MKHNKVNVYRYDRSYIPSSGTVSELAGIDSLIVFRNIIREKSIVAPSGSFSPDSGGKVKPKIARNPIKPHGTSKFFVRAARIDCGISGRRYSQ